MGARLAAWSITLFLLGLLVLGFVLLRYAEEMPAPGLLLITIAGGALLYRFWGPRRSKSQGDADEAFAAADESRESYQYEVERRRRGEFDSDMGNDSTR